MSPLTVRSWDQSLTEAKGQNTACTYAAPCNVRLCLTAAGVANKAKIYIGNKTNYLSWYTSYSTVLSQYALNGYMDESKHDYVVLSILIQQSSPELPWNLARSMRGVPRAFRIQ